MSEPNASDDATQESDVARAQGQNPCKDRTAGAAGDLHIALTIAGAVALGAFEGGALAALIKAVQGARSAAQGASPRVTIDAIGAASAGSITAAAAAKALVSGADPIEIMLDVWVNGASAQNLLLGGRGSSSPLTMDRLGELAQRIVTQQGNGALAQPSHVHLSFSLTNLRGLAYRARQDQSKDAVPHKEALETMSYQDWAVFEVDGGTDFTALHNGSSSVVDAALASGANPLGFLPRTLRRTFSNYPNEPELYNFPCATPCPDPATSTKMWYSDGGDIDNEPLGNTLNLSNGLDAVQDKSWQRLQLLIHPFPESPPLWNDPTWANPNIKPKWLPTLIDVLKIIRWQSLYDDIQTTKTVNDMLQTKGRLEKVMDGVFSKLSSEQQEALGTSLKELLPDNCGDSQSPDLNELFSRALDRVGDLKDKNRVDIEVVSPYLARGMHGVPLDRILAGHRWSAFFGFFDKAARSSDFALGYVCMLNWMNRSLRKELGDEGFLAALRSFCSLEWQGKSYMNYGLSDCLRAEAWTVMDGRVPTQSWEVKDFGGAGPLSLKPRAVGELVHVIYRTGRALF